MSDDMDKRIAAPATAYIAALLIQDMQRSSSILTGVAMIPDGDSAFSNRLQVTVLDQTMTITVELS